MTALLKKANQLRRGTLSDRLTVAARSYNSKLSSKTLLSVKEQRNYNVYGRERSREGVNQPPDRCSGYMGAQGWLSSQEGGRCTHHESMPPERGKEGAQPRHCWRLSGPSWLSAFNTFWKGLP